jgi:DNA-damage-inducible protein D
VPEAGSAQAYEKIVSLKLTAPDGKQRDTDCAEVATLLRIVQTIPSPKAEPIRPAVLGSPVFNDGRGLKPF